MQKEYNKDFSLALEMTIRESPQSPVTSPYFLT